MTDEKDKELLDQPAAPAPVDDWASAFAALEEVPPAAPAADASVAAGEPGSGDGAAQPAPTTGEPSGDGDGADVGPGDHGGPGLDSAGAGEVGGDGAEVDVEAVVSSYSQQIEEQATNDTLELFLSKTDESGRKLIRQTDGELGATINDPDIYRVGEDGMPVFVNPDTGKPFTGDDPRGQAQAWVDRYNAQLKETFNRVAAQHHAELEKQYAPIIETVRFAPVYDKLDPIRQQMFDALVEGHEITDEDGDVVGYDVDLNDTLDRVNRQVAAIQASRKNPPSSPALDMPNSGGGVSDEGAPKSLEEAIARAQQAELDKLKK